MEANEIQIGGTHYQRVYQHWDFVCDSELHYLLGNATKYISRWRDKNGIEDLKKTAHYISKAVELGIEPPATKHLEECVEKFISQLPYMNDREIIHLICSGEYQHTQNLISNLVIGHTHVDLDESKSRPNYVYPDHNYVYPDHNYIKG